MFDGALSNVDEYRAGAHRPLPVQEWEFVQILADRYYRGVDAMRDWMEVGTKCVNYFEGKQWKADDLRKLEQQGRPGLVINRIRPLVKLVYGYHLNNRTQGAYVPASDGSGSAEVAATLSHLSKSVDQRNDCGTLLSEAYLDGLLTGRGFVDERLNFDKNIYGDIETKIVDPFSVIIDADAAEYDPSSWGHVSVDRWIDIDEVAHNYGPKAAEMVQPFINSLGGNGSWANMLYGGDFARRSPSQTFSQDSTDNRQNDIFRGRWAEWVDPYRKTVRMIDHQHFVRTWRWHFVDLGTGDLSPVPDHFDADRVQRLITLAGQFGQHIVLQNVACKRLRWSHMIGDVVVFDRWSPYDAPTITPYFPYFRRGQTQGMVHDLLGPQDEVNYRRSARLNIVGRSSNGGWIYQKGQLDPEMERKLEREGSKPGFNLKWDSKGNQMPTPPQPIAPGGHSQAQSELEHEAVNDMEAVSGINKAALGQQDGTNISGRNLLANQAQAVMGMEGFQASWHRTVKIIGRNRLTTFQRHYTRERIVRVRGTNGSNPIEVMINQATAAGIVNNISAGRYEVDTAEQPLSESFLAATYSELMDMMKAGIPVPPAHIIDASSYPRKEELKAAVAQAAAAGVVPPAPGGGGGGGSGQPAGRKPEPGGPPRLEKPQP